MAGQFVAADRAPSVSVGFDPTSMVFFVAFMHALGWWYWHQRMFMHFVGAPYGLGFLVFWSSPVRVRNVVLACVTVVSVDCREIRCRLQLLLCLFCDYPIKLAF